MIPIVTNPQEHSRDVKDMETWVVYVFLTLVVGLSCLLCQLQKHVFYKQMHNAIN